MNDLRRSLARASMRAALAVGGAVFLLAVLPLLFGLRYFGLDLTRCDLGLLCAVAAQRAQGESLWLSSAIGMGEPLWLRPDAQLSYPLRWPLLLAPPELVSPELAASIGVVVHLSLAAIATTWLLRTFRIPPRHAAIWALVFVASGTVCDLVSHAMYLVAALWLPLGWAAARTVLTRRAAARAATAALAAAFAGCLLGGEPQAAAILAALVGAEVVRTAVTRRRQWSALVVTALASGGGALIGLVPWWPALAELALTQRSGAAQDVLAWSYGPAAWLGTLWPNAGDGEFAPGRALWELLGDAPVLARPWNPTPYVGVGVVVLVLSMRLSRRAATAAVAAGTALACALGPATFVMPALITVVPPLTLFRYPAKYLVVFTLALVVLAAVSAHGMRRRRSRRTVAIAVGLLALQIGAIAWLNIRGPQLRAHAFASPGPVDAFPLPHIDVLLRDSALHAVVLLVVVLGLLVTTRPALRAVLPWVIALDVLTAATTTLRVGPTLADVETVADVLITPKRGPGARVCVAHDVTRARYRVGEDTGGWSTFVYQRRWLAPELHACEPVRSPFSYSLLRSRTSAMLEQRLAEQPVAIARAVGCDVVIGDAGPAPAGATALLLPDGRAVPGAAAVWAIDDPLAEAFVLRDPLRIDDEGALVAAVAQSTSAADAVRLLDDPLARLAPHAQLPPGTPGGAARVTWQDPTAATLVVEGQGSAVVGVRTAFAVGWQATQGGAALPVIRSAGKHVAVSIDDVARGPVLLRYHSPRRWLSIGGALCGAVLLVAALAAARTRSRRTQAGPRDGP